MMAISENLPFTPKIQDLVIKRPVFNTDLFRVKGLDPAPFNLAKELAKRVTNDKNKDATVLFVGQKGHGKSVSSLGLAHGVMEEIQKIQPQRTCEDIFNWPRDIAVIDPAPAVARQVARVLDKNGLLTARRRRGRVTYYTSGDKRVFAKLLRKLTDKTRVNVRGVALRYHSEVQ